MKLNIISHRGNINGPGSQCERVNVENALEKGYDVEVDVRLIAGKFLIGHDKPLYEMPNEWLTESINSRLWFHAKDYLCMIELIKLNQNIKTFLHNDEPSTKVFPFQHVWIHPNLNSLIINRLMLNDIILDIEGYPRISKNQIKNYPFGVCSDWCDEWNEWQKWKNWINE